MADEEQYSAFDDNDDDRLFDNSANETSFLGENAVLGLGQLHFFKLQTLILPKLTNSSQTPGVEDFPAFAWTSPKTISRLASALCCFIAFVCMSGIDGFGMLH